MPVPRWLVEVGSTQDEARTLAEGAAVPGTAVVADVQTAGRGRLGRRWEAAPEAAVQLSVVLRPACVPASLPLLSLAAGVAVRDACGMGGLKWPNDLLAPDDRKLAGLLAEADVQGGRVRWLVVGVGVNVTAAPPLPVATHLAAWGTPPARERLAVDLVAGILAWTRRAVVDPGGVLDAWRARSAVLGRSVRVADRAGIAEDVAEDGALLLRTPHGSLERVVAGDVEMVRTLGGPPS